MTRSPGTTTALKLMNRNKVYQYIYENGNVSKQDIVLALGLSLPTVSQNLTELFEMGLLRYSGKFESRGGRKPKKISIVPEARKVIGVELKKDHINILAIDLKGNASPKERLELDFEVSDRYGKILAEEIEKYIQAQDIDSEIILGVGISIPGVLSEDKRNLINAPTLKVKNILIDVLTESIPYGTFLENDAKASAFAEQHSRKDMESLAFLLVSEGVGGALIYKGAPYKGMNYRDTEFGHMTVVNQGKQCACGKLGCLESYISTLTLVYGEERRVDIFFEKLKAGDASCLALWEEYLTFLCMGINNIRTIFDCDVILGGILARYIGDYFDEIKRRLGRIAVFESNEEYLYLSNYNSDAGSIGTALHFVDRFIKTV